ncbi:MAG: TonB-dependent receptor [Tannerellaceae bacterium]|nr:TonB-dependent receptor [Tannerellaceae bacterium]
MKLSLFLLIMGISLASASKSYSQRTLLSLDMQSKSVREVLDEIERNSEFVFFYHVNTIDESRKVNISVKNQTINNILDLLLAQTGNIYTIDERQVFIAPKSSPGTKAASPQQSRRTLTGVVTDERGEVIIGANILEKGTSNGVISDVDGKFTLTVNPDAILVVTYIGYSRLEVPVGNRQTLTISLSENMQTLDEVVVVGYGTQKKVNLTGSVTTVKYDQELENRPITDISQVLQGSVPGVWATQFSGNPGEDGATIRIRGYGSLGTSSNSRDPNPLVLIDGIEGKMSEVDPNAIESITVLKDAASAAIYGSRAANGVILIETKKGEVGRVSMSYNGYAGMQQLAHSPEFITNSADFMELWNEAIYNSTGGSPLFPDDVIAAFRTGTDPYRYPNTDFAKEIFRNSFITSHNLTVNVGSQSSSTNISLSYLSNEGILWNTSSERYSLTVNNETKVKDWLRIGARARLQRREDLAPGYAPASNISASGSSTNRAFYLAGFGYPFATPFLEDGKTFGATQALYLSGPNAGKPIVDTRNPFPDLYDGEATTLNNFFRGNVYATVDFTPWLHLTVNYSGQYTANTLDVYNTPNYVYTEIGGTQYKSLDYITNITNSRRINDEWYSTFFTNLNFDKTFNEIHEISGVVGYQQEGLDKRYTMARRMNPPKANLHQVSAGTENIEGEGNRYQWRMLSYFGRVNYALASKYLFEANLRADASSRFNPDKRWGYFPSLSAGWRLGEESFIKNLGIFDNLKLRASWGQLGNQNTGSRNNNDYFPYLTVITQANEQSYNYGNSFAPGAATTALSEYNLTWETTTTTDIGLDVGILNNRLSIEADYFYKKTSDILVALPLPLAMGGLTPPTENIGEVENKGFEFNATWQDRKRSSGLSYRISGNITYVDNKVTKFQGGKSPDQTFLIREGYSFQSLYGYVWDGVYQSNEEGAEHMKNNGNNIPKAGDLKYVDVDGDGRLDNKDMQVLGNTIPKFNYGLNGSVTYKNFDLNVSLVGSAGYTSYFNNYWSTPLNTSGGTIPKRWYDRWTPENPSTTLPRITLNYPWNTYASSFWTADMWWLKLKNVQLGYNIPKPIVNKLKLERLYVYLNGSNLYCWVTEDYEGFDPERDGSGNGSYHYPVPRVYTMGLNITF